MALGTLLAAGATAAASSAASAGMSKLLGGKSKGGGSGGTGFSPPGFNAGGLSAKFTGNNYNITSDDSRKYTVGQLSSTFPQHANEIAGLRERVAPGFSEFRDARLRNIEDARNRAVGNLSENLQRRRVLGSSFGGDALARTEAEFGKAKAEADATSTLQEIEATHSLINEEHGLRRQEFQTFLSELNLQAQIASSMASSVSGALASNAQMEAQLAAQEQAGAGRFFGQNVSGPLSKAVGGFFNNALGGSGGDVGLGSWAPTVTYG